MEKINADYKLEKYQDVQTTPCLSAFKKESRVFKIDSRVHFCPCPDSVFSRGFIYYNSWQVRNAEIKLKCPREEKVKKMAPAIRVVLIVLFPKVSPVLSDFHFP